MKKVWILFSDTNYDTTCEFEKLFWHEPTYDDLKQLGFKDFAIECLIKDKRCIDYEGKYWIEIFEEN